VGRATLVAVMANHSNGNTRQPGRTWDWKRVIWYCKLFYVMQKHHPTPLIMNLERGTQTTAAFTPDYEHPTRRREILKNVKHYDTE
jgi:hypothetical protein